MQTADDKKVRAIYTLMEDQINIEEAQEWDPEFIKELDRREKSFLDGTAKMYTLEDARQAARDSVSKNRK